MVDPSIPFLYSLIHISASSSAFLSKAKAGIYLLLVAP
jgi:hypothetical protein